MWCLAPFASTTDPAEGKRGGADNGLTAPEGAEGRRGQRAHEMRSRVRVGRIYASCSLAWVWVPRLLQRGRGNPTASCELRETVGTDCRLQGIRKRPSQWKTSEA
jgi:hypothetical protein